MEKLDYWVDRAATMVSNDIPKTEMMMAMDRMWRCEFDLPPRIKKMKWIRKVTNTDPHNAIRTGTRVLSSIRPLIKVNPIGDMVADRENMDEMERALQWHFKNAERRRRASILRDIVLSALLYDEIVARVVFLPHQIKAHKAFKGDSKRLEAAERYGKYAITVVNPKDVHIRYSDWMPEEVLYKQNYTLKDVQAFWGEKANALTKKAKSLKHKKDEIEKTNVTVYDQSVLGKRVIYAFLQNDLATYHEPTVEDAVEIIREENNIPFLPWVARVGGTTLYDDPRHQRVPLLYAVHNTNEWKNACVVETLITSEATYYASAPRDMVEGPTDNVEVEYGTPGNRVFVPPGHKYSRLLPPGIDSNLAMIADRINNRIGEATVSKVLRSSDFPAGAAFQTMNLAIQTGAKALNPYKELSEQAMAEIFTHMLYWVDYTGEEITAYPRSNRSREPEEFDPVQMPDGSFLTPDAESATEEKHDIVTIGPDSFAVEHIYIDVELTADIPTDRVSRVNAAGMAVQTLGVSQTSGQEWAGITNPTMEMKVAEDEKDTATKREIERQRMVSDFQREVEVENMKAMESAKMDIQEEMMRRQPQQQGIETATPGTMQEQLRNGSTQQQFTRQRGQGFENTRGGPGFDPASGGDSAVPANPGASKAGQSLRATRGSSGGVS